MNKEDEIANLMQNLEDVKSSLKILSAAIKNEYNPPELADIENSLEIIQSKYSEAIEQAEKLIDNYPPTISDN